MKLLKLRIDNKKGFRSLQQGFEINFHTLTDIKAMETFRPFCFAGLNGSGKSNVLEALANIFYHLEVCVAKYLPESIKDSQNFKRSECTPDAFILEYLIGQLDDKPYIPSNFQKVIISKIEGEEPGIKVYNPPYTEDFIIIPNPKTHKIDKENGIINSSGKILEPQDKMYLPNHIIGYSSGENEILSLPFIKSRLIHLDEYRQATRDNYEQYDEPENSLIYIDNNMSQAVLLTCLLFENETSLAPLREVDNTGILGLRSFRINIHLHNFEIKDEKSNIQKIPILSLLESRQIDVLKKCATSWFLDNETQTLWLDFFVNEATKTAFRKHFNNNGLECFQLFRLLYELNNYFIDEQTKTEVYRSKGIYTDGKLPTPNPSQNVFHFLDFYIIKELRDTGTTKDLLLRSFSDGEHQFIHTMGICLLLKNRRTLLLLDEPETHFNPSWRAKFIKILSDSISANKPQKLPSQDFNVHLLKDILLTSHSPFIISDCMPDNVILFKKDINNKITPKTAKELGFNTYGASVDLILQEIFGMNYSISEHALEEIRILLRKRTVASIIEGAKKFGESYEKGFLYERIEKLNSSKKKKSKK